MELASPVVKRRSKPPPGAVNMLHEFGGFRVAGEFHFPVIPLEGSAGAVGDVAKQHHLGQRPGVVEVAGRVAAGLDGVNPFPVMAKRTGDARLGPLVSLKSFSGSSTWLS